MAFAAAAAPSILCCSQASLRSVEKKGPVQKTQKQKLSSGLGNVLEVVRKDAAFIKKGITKGVEWANEAFRIPQVKKTVEDFVWLRHVEDPRAQAPSPAPSCPTPSYPELSGMDLLMADLQATEAYLRYFHYLSKRWTKPLPETYHPQEVSEYFSLRPHVVAIRFFEVIAAFASAAIRIRLSGVLPSTDKDADNSIAQYNFGMILKETMLKLGPTFIKVGQSLSTRPDIIGFEISKALSELHDQIPAFPRAVAMKIIEEEFGAPVETLFSYLSDEPVAAASFGQVYKGSTLDGLEVAVKVQRPNLRHVVVRDIYLLRLGLGLLQKIAKRKSDLRLYADELGKGFVGELDYTLEAANASEFMEAHSQFTFICVPKVYRHLSRKRVLTMEWMVGESPNDLLFISRDESYKGRQKSDAKRRLLDLVNKGVEASLVQLLETGLLHADPHPGNMRYISAGKLGFLDFGLLCRMEKKHQLAMLSSTIHIIYGEWGSLVNDLIEMDVVRPGTNIRRVTMDLEDALGEVELKDGVPDVKFSRVLSKIWSVALKYHFRMPPYYTLVLRSLASLEGIAVAADPHFKTFEAAYPYVLRKLLSDNSAATRRILHSVVLNRRKEFQWQKLSLFLRMGGTRKGLQTVIASNDQSSLDYHSDGGAGLSDVANLVLRLLASKEGRSVRRLVMAANKASIIQAVVSKEASFFRQQVCRIVADALYQWITGSLGRGVNLSRPGYQVQLANGVTNIELNSSYGLSKPMHDYGSILQDRRLKVIAFSILNAARQDRILMLKFYWASFVIILKASALACHRVLVSLSEAYMGRISFAPKQVVFGA